jgi:YhgE/Pip-like protein
MSDTRPRGTVPDPAKTPRSVPAKVVLRAHKIWIMPALIAGTLIALITLIYVGSVVNPTGHLSGLPVVLVDQDQGATVNGRHVDIGQEVAAGLQSSPRVTTPLGLTATSLSAAHHRMDTDDLYATIVIPADFSAAMLQMYGVAADADATASARPAITILTNQRAGTLGTSIATNVSEPALTAVLQKITAKIASSAPAPSSAADVTLRGDPLQITTQIYRPLPDHTALGLSAFYLALLTVMCGFLGATITNSSIDSAIGYAPTELGPKWRLRRPLPMTRWQTLLTKWAVVAVVAPVLEAVMLAVGVGALRMNAPHLIELWLFGAFAAIVVGLGTLVLCAAFGSMGQLLGMLVFLYLSLASSGGTIPIQALPEPLRWAADVEPLRQILGGVRSIVYFDATADAGLTRGLVMTAIGLAFWLLAGVAVTRYYDRRGLARISPQALAFVNRSIEQAKSEARPSGVATADPAPALAAANPAGVT